MTSLPPVAPPKRFPLDCAAGTFVPRSRRPRCRHQFGRLCGGRTEQRGGAVSGDGRPLPAASGRLETSAREEVGEVGVLVSALLTAKPNLRGIARPRLPLSPAVGGMCARAEGTARRSSPGNPVPNLPRRVSVTWLHRSLGPWLSSSRGPPSREPCPVLGLGSARLWAKDGHSCGACARRRRARWLGGRRPPAFLDAP